MTDNRTASRHDHLSDPDGWHWCTLFQKEQ